MNGAAGVQQAIRQGMDPTKGNAGADTAAAAAAAAAAKDKQLSNDENAQPPSTTSAASEEPVSAALASSASVAADLDALCAPESAVAEEERLRQQREDQEKKAVRDLLSGQEAVLDGQRFSQLDKLLDQTKLYTLFLKEQMEAIESKTEDEPKEGPAKPGDKRKAGGGKGAAAKRRKGAAAQAEETRSATKELCPLLNCDLRDYQLKGIKWLVSLYQNGLNGILADQMGLGKTVQTIGFLSHLRHHGVLGPFMVVGPLSTLPNWVAEFERWCPAMPCLLYHGTKQERMRLRHAHMPTGKVTEKFPVVVTSYEIVIADVKFLQKYYWKYIVVDEGHRLKNFNCKLVRELRTIPTANKLLLTGTPLQNSLSELWSLFNFLLPDVFSNLSDFESWFDFSALSQAGGDKEIIALEQRNKVVSKLHAILKPFMLRRIKSDVETSLPGKMELVLYAHMSDVQRKFNDQLRDNTLSEVMAKLAKSTGGSHGGAMAKLNNVLMQMRKNCNHPDLISAPYENSQFYPTPEVMRAQCGKMQLLDRLLTRLKAGGHKVLIFSQMTKMLDLLDSYLDQQGHRVCRIDGSVPWQERQASMKSFNTDPDVFVFLLSTRAGGLGINLTGADTVIIYDSDWNPHQDLQAMDRAHRIGQQRPVLVFRLATSHSVEGKLLARANSKLMLERLVIKQGAFLHQEKEAAGTSLKADELLDLLKPDSGTTDLPQSGVASDEMLDKLLDRSHLVACKPPPYPLSGVGYEIVKQLDGSGLLKGVE